MRWMAGIFKKLVAPVALRIIFFLAKDHPWWIAGVSVVSGVLAYLEGFLPWYMWALVPIGLFSFFMAIRQTWFPHGFRKKGTLSTDQFLLEYRDRIRDAMQEDFNQIFFRKIQDLYPKLEERGIRMPSIHPFVDSDRWCNYHIRFLKDLEMQIPKIEEGVSLDLEQWNNQVLNIEKGRDEHTLGEAASKKLLNDLEREMLVFILSLVGKRPVTTSDIYTHEPFLEVDPDELHQAFIHLQVNEYIVAGEAKDNNPWAPQSAQRFKVQAVTKEGIGALESR